MHLSHPLLILPVAGVCWLAAGLWGGPPSATSAGPEASNPLAIRQSAYGRTVARLMKDSLHSYWHGGPQAAAVAHVHTAACCPPGKDGGECTKAAAAAGPAGRFSLRRSNAVAQAPIPPLEPAAPSPRPWLQQWTARLTELEQGRMRRNSTFATTTGHRRFLAAAADWRVHLAWLLDPCDAALYEIDHFSVASRAASPEAASKASGDLSVRTIVSALSPQSGPAEVLTGAGAAINLLNEQLIPGRHTPPNPASLQRDWRVLEFCLNRHRELREQASEEDWWSDIPPVRREEIDSYARMLEKLSGTIRQQLVAQGTLSP